MENPFGIKIRPCKKEDNYDFILDITKKTLWPFIAEYREPSQEKFDESYEKNHKNIEILEINKEPIGFFSLSPREDVLNVNRIFLAPEHQKKRIGSFLMKYFETLGYKKITLEVWENNPAVKFYEKLGFNIIQRKGPKVFMEKQL